MGRTKPEVLNASSRMKRALETVNRLEEDLVVAKEVVKQVVVRTAVKSFKSFHQRLSAARARIDNCIATIDHSACSLYPFTIGFVPGETFSGTDAIYYLLCQSGVDPKEFTLVGFVSDYVFYVLKTFITHLYSELLLHTEIPLLSLLLEDLEREKITATQRFLCKN